VPAAPPERRTTEIDKQRVPMAARPYRLLALVKQDAVVRVQKEPDDTVLTWPHLLAIEFFAAAVISVFLVVMGVFINAPLEELANSAVTPVVTKAPWYLVGLQELLVYFHPTVVGVLGVAFILVGAGLVPYIDRGPRGDGGSPRPSDRKTGVMIFTIFCVSGLVDLHRSLLPHPRHAWSLPWVDSLFFAL
jgi:quinol-cytochrome oxidoreductase complex cytochrome b subunit